MAKVNLCHVEIKENPSLFLDPLEFEISFECSEELSEDLEFKIIYVGSAECCDYDQVLDSVLVGPVPIGRHMFLFKANPPDPCKVLDQDLIGVTVILLTGSYRDREFVRVGYYVNNDYVDPEMKENPPAKPVIEKLQRNILVSEPRVTKFHIKWDD
ncbi:histone chaperone asf1 isoform X2 [Exaiptasia diaphana]|uniref:Anti-silencing function protein 1 n=1 Tax=Exaiptasia diaphana TaxID=2652724 RepID=A0A913X7J0_EXADI|nr:histone chaperone asf1 isoform X1 [Exaiptasia diaphana]XP_020900108.1 histone chaperone asf1 isoform X2 [Exaiptasia diaphana]KXJ14531.1 Histone chaperone asf1 [Exaiptasia diaphana]